MKTCSMCKVEKRIEEFNKCKGGKDGLRSNCKHCQSIMFSDWAKNNKEHLRAYKNKQKPNPDKNKERQRRYRKKNADKLNIKARKYKKTMPEKSKIKN